MFGGVVIVELDSERRWWGGISVELNRVGDLSYVGIV
jgi:hypothetical protein